MTSRYKTLADKHLLDPDPTSALLSNQIDSAGNVSPMTGEDWEEIILEPDLNDNVPDEIQRLFETARGAMVYGYFFYPLFTLGCEQLYRVTEAAATAKCKSLNAPKSRMKDFDRQIKFLNEAGIISDEDLQVWNSFRRMRNESSHPKQQSLYSPGMFIPVMRRVVERINGLFE